MTFAAFTPTKSVRVTWADHPATPARSSVTFTPVRPTEALAPGVTVPRAAVAGAEMERAPTGTSTVTVLSAVAADAGRTTEPTRAVDTAAIRDTREMVRMVETFAN
jgi:hypothetical protein